MREFCPTCCQVLPTDRQKNLTLTNRIMAEVSRSLVPLTARRIYQALVDQGVDTTRESVEKSCRRMRDQGRLKRANRFDPGARVMVSGWESALEPAAPETLDSRQNPVAHTQTAVEQESWQHLGELVIHLTSEGQWIDRARIIEAWTLFYPNHPVPDRIGGLQPMSYLPEGN